MERTATAEKNLTQAGEKEGLGKMIMGDVKSKLGAYFRRHWFVYSLIILAMIIAIPATRGFWQPGLCAVRAHMHYIWFSLALLAVFYSTAKWSKGWIIKVGGPLLMIIIAAMQIGLACKYNFNMLEYCRLYERYRTLNQLNITEMPTTAHERILPQGAVNSLAKTKVTGTYLLQTPDFVRFGERYGWSTVWEPIHLSRLTGKIEYLYFVSGEDPSPSFSDKDLISVNFETGENLVLGKNTATNVIKTFWNFWRFLNYQPADVRYFLNDAGIPVQVVSLIRMEGWFFPRPVFGGVVVVPQVEESDWRQLLRLLTLGLGEWIPPEKIKDHPFLVGQNIMPAEVSRYMGLSFRFQKGFFGPAPWRHTDDIRISDLPESMNQQPFTLFFQFADNTMSKLYQYLALEPFNPENSGLNCSVLVPADGIGPILVYHNARRKDSITGISAIPQKIRDAKKEYSWGDVALVVEIRPWIKKIDDAAKFFWMGTVVTLNKEKSKSNEQGEQHNNAFITGSSPEIVLVDGKYGKPIWVDPDNQESWVPTVSEKMKTKWSEENAQQKKEEEVKK